MAPIGSLLKVAVRCVRNGKMVRVNSRNGEQVFAHGHFETTLNKQGNVARITESDGKLTKSNNYVSRIITNISELFGETKTTKVSIFKNSRDFEARVKYPDGRSKSYTKVKSNLGGQYDILVKNFNAENKLMSEARYLYPDKVEKSAQKMIANVDKRIYRSEVTAKQAAGNAEKMLAPEVAAKQVADDGKKIFALKLVAKQGTDNGKKILTPEIPTLSRKSIADAVKLQEKDKVVASIALEPKNNQFNHVYLGK